jgi:hypothetical protein
MAIALLVYLAGQYVMAKAGLDNEISYVAHADTISVATSSIPVEQLETKLDTIVWDGESESHTMQDGEIFPTFDPTKAMYAQCILVGGKQPKDCLSYGPRQEKIGTIEYYWPFLHNGQTLTDKEARDIAEGNDTSKRFFLDCAENIKECADNWATFEQRKTEGQIYLDLIREAKQINL